MKFLILALTLTFAQGAFAKSLISCNSHNSVFLTLEGKGGVIAGRMNHNYNGALIVCKLGALEALEAQGEMKCAGLWNMAFNEEGNEIDKTVVITIKKMKTGKLQATFTNDWDGRSPEYQSHEVLNCE